MDERIRNLDGEETDELRILLTDTNRCPFVPRLALRFERPGARVAVLCLRRGNPLKVLGERVQIFPYSGLQPMASLRRSIEAFRPDLVISACDRSIQHLHELHGICRAEGGAALWIAGLIERSLGAPQSYSVVSSREALQRAACEEGIPVPRFRAVEKADDLDSVAAEIPLPWVIKADGSWGGRGVRIVHSLTEARIRYRELTDEPGVYELVRRMALDRDRDWGYRDWRRPRPAVIVQAFVPGRPANCVVFCHEGEILAGIAVEAVQTQGATGPATIVQVVEGQPMLQAAGRLACRLRLSGIFGLDFVLGKGGATSLIEMNPRCTPLAHLPLGEGRDLVAACWAHLKGRPVPHTASVTDKSLIAYFPNYLSGKDRARNTLLLSSYEDIPLDEPELVQEFLNPRSPRSISGQTIDWLRGHLSQTRSPGTILFEGATAGAPAVTAELDGPA